jgi:uridylate kinase
VGGSLIVPDQIDTAFLKGFKDLLTQEMSGGLGFVVIAGGGKTARRYQDAAAAVAEVPATDLDWLGIHSTRLNGHLLRTIFRESAHPVMITNPDEVADVPPEAPLIIAAGYRPGASTDLRAVQIAERTGAMKVVNLSNIDYVYDSDPRENPSAKKFERLSWADFRALIPAEWDPGLSAPFDPVAAREAERLGLEAAIINGAHLERFKNYLDGRPFEGTVIS